MSMPAGVQDEGHDSSKYALRCNKNIYGQRQAGHVWNKYLINKLEIIGFVQLSIDSCVLYKGKAVYVLYTADSIIADPGKNELVGIIRDIEKSGLQITVEGKFLGIRMDRRKDGTIHMSQHNLQSKS